MGLIITSLLAERDREGLERLRAERRYDERWLLLAARDTQRLAAPCAVASVTAAALVLSVAMERAEQLLGGGAPYGGVPLFGTAGVAVALIFAVAAAGAVLALAASLRAVVAAFDVVVRALRTSVVFFIGSPHLFDAGDRPHCSGLPRFVAVTVRAGGRRGERAPPRYPRAVS